MKARKKISEAEIEQQLIADAEDPDAWEAPITVPAIRAPRRNGMVEPMSTVGEIGSDTCIASREDKI